MRWKTIPGKFQKERMIPKRNIHQLRLHISLINKIMMKVTVLFVLTLLSACDDSLRIIGIELTRIPDKLVYIAGVDYELDFSGGEIRYLHKDASIITYESLTEESLDASITHDVDFRTPGAYTVRITYGEPPTAKYDEFVIFVISKEEIMEWQIDQSGFSE